MQSFDAAGMGGLHLASTANAEPHPEPAGVSSNAGAPEDPEQEVRRFFQFQN
jgi:hypothetical protein